MEFLLLLTMLPSVAQILTICRTRLPTGIRQTIRSHRLPQKATFQKRRGTTPARTASFFNILAARMQKAIAITAVTSFRQPSWFLLEEAEERAIAQSRQINRFRAAPE